MILQLTVHSGWQKLNLLSELPYHPQVAVDGERMVVASSDESNLFDTNVIFFSLVDGVWRQTNQWWGLIEPTQMQALRLA